MRLGAHGERRVVQVESAGAVNGQARPASSRKCAQPVRTDALPLLRLGRGSLRHGRIALLHSDHGLCGCGPEVR
jgi:hypothetical protein